MSRSWVYDTPRSSLQVGVKPFRYPTFGLTKEGLGAISVPVVFEILFVCLFAGLLQQAQHEIRQEGHMRAVIAETNMLTKLFYDATGSLLAYGMTRSGLASERYQEVVDQIPRQLASLKTLVGSRSNEKECLRRLALASGNGLELLNQTKGTIDSGGRVMALRHIRQVKGELHATFEQLRRNSRLLIEEERSSEVYSPIRAIDVLMPVLCLSGMIHIGLFVWIVRLMSGRPTSLRRETTTSSAAPK